MKLYYLEIVSPDVDAVCAAYEGAPDTRFEQPDVLNSLSKGARKKAHV